MYQVPAIRDVPPPIRPDIAEIRRRLLPQAKPIATAIVRRPKYVVYPYDLGPVAPRDWLLISGGTPAHEVDLCEEPRRISIASIVIAVAEQFGILPTDILSQRRTANIVMPRQIVMYLAKMLTLRSLPEIGRRLGNRDHTTILYGVRKIDSLLATDQMLAFEVAAITAKLKGA